MKTDRFYRDSCCRRLSSPTVRTKGSFTLGQACRRIFCAGQIGSRGISEAECMIFPIRELVAFPRRGERSSAQWLLPVPALLDDSRWQPVQVPWYGSSGRADRPCSGRTDSIHDSEPDLWKWLEIAALVSPDQFLSQWHHFGHGSFFESLSSLTPRPILAVPFAEVPSPNPIGSPSGGSHTPSAPPSCSRPLSTTDGGNVFRRFLQTKAAAWKTGSHHGRKIVPRTPGSARPCLPFCRLLLQELFMAPWYRPGSPLIKVNWLSLSTGTRTESLIWVQAWAMTHSVATQNTTTMFTMVRQCFLSAVADNRPSAPFWFDHQPRPTKRRDGRKAEEELSGRTGCVIEFQQAGSRFSIRQLERSLSRGRNLLASGSAVPAAHYPWTGPARRLQSPINRVDRKN